MEPPSTPAPVALRGRALDTKLGEIAPDRPAPASARVPSTRQVDPRVAMEEVERQVVLHLAEERRQDVPSHAPVSLRGRDLEEALAVARHGPLSSSGPRSRVTVH
jgi:hypothetical protein